MVGPDEAAGRHDSHGKVQPSAPHCRLQSRPVRALFTVFPMSRGGTAVGMVQEPEMKNLKMEAKGKCFDGIEVCWTVSACQA